MGRKTPPRVRRALNAPEHAQRPTPRTPRRAKPRPCPLPAPTPIKPAEASAVLPRALSTSSEQEIVRACRADGVPAAARSPATIDWAAEPSPTPTNPRNRFYVPRWSSQSEESSSASPETPDQGHQTAGERRSSPTVSYSSIPCTGRLISTPWSSPCPWIDLYRRGKAGAHAAAELAHLRTWTGRFRPSPSSSRTSLWSQGPPEANPTLRWTSPAAGKPRRPFSFCGYCSKGGRDLGEEGIEVRGFFEMLETRMNSCAGV
jgi:hypothetical protein